MRYTNENALALVLAGGRSERLFPLDRPKPLLEVEGKSLLDHSLERLKSLKHIRVVCNEKTSQEIRRYRKKKGLSKIDFLIEPEPRDTAAAVGFALRQLSTKPPAWLSISSADQFFPGKPRFSSFLKQVRAEIQNSPDYLFLGGTPASAKPAELHSQYGWIVATKQSGSKASLVKEFVEKPKPKKLSQLYRQGAMVNCGMFFGTYQSFQKAYQLHYPDALRKNFSFRKLEKQPIDRAIFEKFVNVKMLKLPYQWEDLGTWEMYSKFVISKRLFECEASANFALSDREEEIYVFGASELGIVKCGNKILVMPLNRSKEMKNFLKKVKA